MASWTSRARTCCIKRSLEDGLARVNATIHDMELRANLFNDFIHAIRPQEPVYAMDLLADMDDAEDVDHADDI